jgi:hypothetical protein
LPPSPASPGIRLPSASSARCDGLKAVSFHHCTVQQRLVALDVGDPQLIGPSAADARSTRSGRVAILAAAGRADVPPSAYASQTGVAHQSSHPLETDVSPLIGQLTVDPRPTIRAPSPPVNLFDAFLEHRIGLPPSRRCALQPRVVPVRIVWPEGSNSRASSSGVRPDLTWSVLQRRSGVEVRVGNRPHPLARIGLDGFHRGGSPGHRPPHSIVFALPGAGLARKDLICPL